MNILFVNEIPMNPTCGGIERVTDLLSRELIRRGYNVVCLCARYDDNQMNYSFPAEQLALPFDGAFENPENIKFYTDVLSKYEIDIVVNQRGWAPFMNKVLGCNGVKVVSVIHTIPTGAHIMYMNGILRHNKTFNGIGRYACKLLIYPLYYVYKYCSSLKRQKKHYCELVAKSSAVVLLSNKCRVEFEKMVMSSTSKCITTSISNPNVGKLVSPADIKKENIVLYVGRLSENEKRPMRMLKIWEMLYKNFPDWKMIFVGAGDALNDLKTYTSKQIIERVEFTGQVSDVEDYYRKSDFICLTSDFEGWGMTLTEGMTLGCIPFTFDNYGAAEEIIDDGENGCLIPAFNLKQYAFRLSELMSNEDLRTRMSAAAQKKVESFNVINVVNKWIELFGRVCNMKGGHSDIKVIYDEKSFNNSSGIQC